LLFTEHGAGDFGASIGLLPASAIVVVLVRSHFEVIFRVEGLLFGSNP
jgi:hypothetical protein